MVLRTGSDPDVWESIFSEAGISVTTATLYADICKQEAYPCWTVQCPELCFKTMREMFAILKLIKDPPPTNAKPCPR